MKTQKEVLKQTFTFLIILSILTIGVYFWMFNSSKQAVPNPTLTIS
jgi:uncharacterized membrane protein (DUF106 family)